MHDGRPAFAGREFFFGGRLLGAQDSDGNIQTILGEIFRRGQEGEVGEVRSEASELSTYEVGFCRMSVLVRSFLSCIARVTNYSRG